MTLTLYVLAIGLALFFSLRYFRTSPFVLERSHVFSEATISRQFVPRMNHFAKEGDTLTIVGGDGFYFSTPGGDRLKNAIKSWLDRGVKIRYVLVSGTVFSNRALCELAERNENLTVLFVNGARVEEEASQRLSILVEKYKTLHPTILSSDQLSEVKIAWVERYHPEMSHIANDVHYRVSADGAITLDDLDVSIDDLDFLIKHALSVTKDNAGVVLADPNLERVQ